MLIVTLQRNKCIGCNYCAELAPGHFRMSKKDGKSVLLHATEKKGFFTLKTPDDRAHEQCEHASRACPVKIISVKKILSRNIVDKKMLRKVYMARRKGLSSQEVSQASLRVLSLLEGLPIWDKRCYHIFLPIRKFNEFDTYLIVDRLFASGKQVVTSRSDFSDFSMQTCLLTKDKPLKLNAYGIPEPLEAEQVNPLLIDVVFVPLLAFDDEGYRVGYGKGFYDRFFTLCRSEILKIGLSLFRPVRQISDRDATDIPLDIAVCPDKVYRFGTSF